MSQPAEDEPIELLLETSDDEEEAAGEQVIVDVGGRKRERSADTYRVNAQNKRRYPPVTYRYPPVTYRYPSVTYPLQDK